MLLFLWNFGRLEKGKERAEPACKYEWHKFSLSKTVNFTAHILESKDQVSHLSFTNMKENVKCDGMGFSGAECV